MADQGKEGFLSPYLRRKRFEAAFPYLKGQILDFGCGSGALAALVDANCYIGVEVDELSLERAKKKYPGHRFASGLPETGGYFDTIISLAVIEHVSKPAEFLRSLSLYLSDSPDACIVITTPHPSVAWVHDIGAALGLFSKHANEEHQDLLNRADLESAGLQTGLKLSSYRRFLFGANQVACFKKEIK